MLKEVRLKKTDAIIVKALLNSILGSLQLLQAHSRAAFYELVMQCRNDEYKFSSGIAKILRDLAFLEVDDTVNHFVKDVVLSAVEGEGFDMIITDPVAPPVKQR